MNWLNQDWEHELQKIEMYVLEARKELEQNLEEYYRQEAEQLPALIEYITQENKKQLINESRASSI